MLSISFAFGLMTPIALFAATTPAIGATANYTVLGSTYTNTTVTTINGGVGFTTPPAVIPLGTHAYYGSGAPYSTAGTDQGILLSNLNSQPCTFTFAPGAIDLSTDTTHGIAGVYVPGVYCSTGAMNISGTFNLNGAGTYIFRPVGALNSTTGSVITLTGSSACDVFWTPTSATTLATNTTFAGTIIDNAGITVGANVTWSGQALAFGGTITTDTDTISIPACVIPVPIPTPTPVVTSVSSGGGGSIASPAIRITKVPSQSFVTGTSTSIIYTYTVWNPQTSPVILDIKVTDDKCINVTFVNGDLNNNGKLEIGENWKYTCTSLLSKTTTNTGTVIGHSDDGYYQPVYASALATVTISNGYIMTSVATSTVIYTANYTSQPVSVTNYPSFPNTGLDSDNSVSTKTIIVLVFLISLVFTLYFLKGKKVI